MYYLGDVHKLTTFDGESLVFTDEEIRLLAYIGYGAPPIEYHTQRGYKQHGETKVDYLLAARTITLELWREPACNRIAYWENRQALHDLLRPNRGGSLELTLTISDGTQRSILVDPNPGAVFDTPQTEDNSWEILETLDFTAFNPIWYSPTLVTSVATKPTDQHLVFPIIFPIEFGEGGTLFETTITYRGSWQEHPTIILTGPYEAVRIENQTTGAIIELIVQIIAGQTRTIDLTPGAIQVYDQDGEEAFDELGENTNLVDFTIEPHPMAEDGINEFSINMPGASLASGVTIRYKERYFAI